uniref:AlNc14C226G9223 protein n=1 Tax=Albugo laibachii Nc14 TaxID=890382 RepID=F0WS85_9STRA|nr:AlNc14C226G9223 [Albugo laibachii Nc14]|eukprot:CCA24203.1 AlNc14C226G9223 [Albugo laibachii Nc14]
MRVPYLMRLDSSCVQYLRSDLDVVVLLDTWTPLQRMIDGSSATQITAELSRLRPTVQNPVDVTTSTSIPSRTECLAGSNIIIAS